MTETKFISPLFVVLPRKTVKDKRVYLNQNTYRNLHRFTEGEAKKTYTKLMKEQLFGKMFKGQIEISYTLYVPSKRITDISNVCCIVDKYFSDSLTHYGCIEDDNYNFIPLVSYKWGGVDKGNGRVEIIVRELK